MTVSVNYPSAVKKASPEDNPFFDLVETFLKAATGRLKIHYRIKPKSEESAFHRQAVSSIIEALVDTNRRGRKTDEASPPVSAKIYGPENTTPPTALFERDKGGKAAASIIAVTCNHYTDTDVDQEYDIHIVPSRFEIQISCPETSRIRDILLRVKSDKLKRDNFVKVEHKIDLYGSPHCILTFGRPLNAPDPHYEDRLKKFLEATMQELALYANQWQPMQDEQNADHGYSPQYEFDNIGPWAIGI